MKRCKFCEAMKSYKQIEEFTHEWNADTEKRLGKYMTVYSVAIVKHSWYRKLGKKHAGRSTDYRYRGLGYALNYCPECGKSLKGGQDEQN